MTKLLTAHVAALLAVVEAEAAAPAYDDACARTGSPAAPAAAAAVLDRAKAGLRAAGPAVLAALRLLGARPLDAFDDASSVTQTAEAATTSRGAALAAAIAVACGVLTSLGLGMQALVTTGQPRSLLLCAPRGLFGSLLLLAPHAWGDAAAAIATPAQVRAARAASLSALPYGDPDAAGGTVGHASSVLRLPSQPPLPAEECFRLHVAACREVLVLLREVLRCAAQQLRAAEPGQAAPAALPGGPLETVLAALHGATPPLSAGEQARQAAARAALGADVALLQGVAADEVQGFTAALRAVGTAPAAGRMWPDLVVELDAARALMVQALGGGAAVGAYM
jgi:hypothetical protein